MTLDLLINAAKAGQWDEIDKAVPSICDEQEYKDWAYYKGTEDPNDDVRDLAVTILQNAKEIPYKGWQDKMFVLMSMDDNPYVRFRAAFVLAGHGVGKYRAKVLEVLHKAEHDDAVAELAKEYLGELE